MLIKLKIKYEEIKEKNGKKENIYIIIK